MCGEAANVAALHAARSRAHERRVAARVAARRRDANGARVAPTSQQPRAQRDRFRRRSAATSNARRVVLIYTPRVAVRLARGRVAAFSANRARRGAAPRALCPRASLAEAAACSRCRAQGRVSRSRRACRARCSAASAHRPRSKLPRRRRRDLNEPTAKRLATTVGPPRRTLIAVSRN